MLKKFFGAILAGMLLFTLVGGTASADTWSYYIPTYVKELLGTAETWVSIIYDLPNQSNADLGYISQNGSNSRVQESNIDRPYMLQTLQTGIVVPSLSSFQEKQFRQYLEYDPESTTFDVVLGDTEQPDSTGNITVTDNASIELEDNFFIRVVADFNTANWTDKYIVQKLDAFSIFVSEIVSGNVTANWFGSANITALDVPSTNGTEIIVAADTRPDFNLWAADAFVGVPFGGGILPIFVLDEVELTSSSTSVTFSSLDVTIAKLDTMLGVTSRHLVVVVNAASPDAVASREVRFQFNGDTGNNYNYQTVRGVAAAASSVRSDASSSILAFGAPGTTYPGYGGGTILIPHAFNTVNHKSNLSYGGANEYEVTAITGRWADTDAITSLTLIMDTTGEDFATGSVFQIGVVDERYLVEEAEITANATANFAGIPQEEGDLVVIGYMRGTRPSTGSSVNIEINGDGADASYFSQFIQGRSAVVNALSANDRAIGDIPVALSLANVFNAATWTISNYADGTNDPSIVGLVGFHRTAFGTSKIWSARRNNVAAVTDLEFSDRVSSDFAIGTLVSLYLVPKTPIARVELAAPQVSIIFDEIPQGFENLQLNIYARSSGAVLTDSLGITINDDAVNANYERQDLNGAGAAVGASRNAGIRFWFTAPGTFEGANEFSSSIATFYQYSKTDRHKHVSIIEGRNENNILIASNRWSGDANSAITKIELYLNGGNFVAGSVFELVGWIPDKTFYISVDGVIESIMATDNWTVVDNSNPFIINRNGAMSFMESFELWKDNG